jgi:hypothetical protein
MNMEGEKIAPLQPKKAGSFIKFVRWVIFIAIVVLAFLFWWNYYYVFGEGVKSGELNYVVKKGNIFKTYEGKLIQTGFKSKSVGTVQSYEFEFPVADDSIANVLMNNSGKYFDLHYKEYKGTIPWRGYSNYIVDKIILMKEVGR